MWEVADRFKVKIGGAIFINVQNLIVVETYDENKPKEEPEKESLFTMKRSLSDGLLGIDYDIFNRNRDKVATVHNGFIVDGDKENYGIEKKHDHYTITDKSTGKLICDIKKRENPNFGV